MLQKCDSKTNVKNGLPQIHATVHFHERDEIRTHDLPLRSTIEPLSSVFTYVQESRFSSGFFRIPNLFRFTEVRLCR